MNRRAFLAQALLSAGAALPLASCANRSAAPTRSAGRHPIRWTRPAGARLFSDVSWNGASLVAGSEPGLLDGGCRLLEEAPARGARLSALRASATHGPLRVELHHRLHDSHHGRGEDLLEAVLTARNASSQPRRVELFFATSVQPAHHPEDREVYLPVSAAGLFGDERFAALGVKHFFPDCRQRIGRNDLQAHYLEPMASDPAERETRALLLAPVVDISQPPAPLRVALFAPSLEPRRFSTARIASAPDGQPAWRVGRWVVLAPGQLHTERCWLFLHEGDAGVAWQAFHRFAHRDDHPPIGWASEFKVHYYDYLSSSQGERGRRGDGYEADLPHFRAFRVGLATQHGWYPTLGDYIHPDRRTWQAMRGDASGPATMSFERMKDRIRATRLAGAKAAVYLHPVLFDDAAPFFARMRDSVLVNAAGEPVAYPWQGPDTVGRNWRASLASPEWRAHLLQQAQWIMEILEPDALTVDETFAGLGMDHQRDHAGPTSAAAIDFYRKLRALVRSFGPERALFMSDCSMSPFVLWGDGECGDHAYPGLLGHPLYTQTPVRYLAALGNKPWRPCAWHFQHMWETQMRLARQVGAGVGVSNGWIEYTGLARLSADVASRMTRDIQSLLTGTAS